MPATWRIASDRLFMLSTHWMKLNENAPIITTFNSYYIITENWFLAQRMTSVIQPAKTKDSNKYY